MGLAGITFSVRNQNRGAWNTWHLVHNPVPLICIFFAKTQQLQCKNILMNAKSSKGRCVPQVISLILVGQKLGMMSIDVKLKVTFLIYLTYIVGAMYRCCVIRMANGIRVWSGHQSFAGLLSKPHLLPLSTEIMQWSRTFIPLPEIYGPAQSEHLERWCPPHCFLMFFRCEGYKNSKPLRASHRSWRLVRKVRSTWVSNPFL